MVDEPPRRFRRFLPPLILFLGLGLVGISLVVLGGATSGSGAVHLEPAYLAAHNGTAIMAYPTEYFGYNNAHIRVTYSYPQHAGDAYFLTCEDARRLIQNETLVNPILSFEGLRQHDFVVNRQTVGAAGYMDEFFGRGPKAAFFEDAVCFHPSVVFAWAVPSGDPAENKPDVEVVFQNAQLDSGTAGLLLTLSIGGALLVLLGGLAWARERGATTHEAPGADDSTAEAIRRALDRMGAQLTRTRQHLLFAGVLGIFLWYPILVPWSWQAASRATTRLWIPWAVAGAALLFLAVLTLLWAREVVRLDRELAAWRNRMKRLRDRETGLMDSLEGR